jgi:hypothetical protein
VTNKAQGKTRSLTQAPVVVGAAGVVEVAVVRQRIDELVAMGYEQMLQERLVSNRPTEDKSRLKFLLL